MNNLNSFFSVDTAKNIISDLPVKLAASAGVATIAEAMGVQVQLFLIFCALACLDVFTRWIALSYKLWGDMYPQTPCTVWQATKFIRQAHRWRYIKSEAMRNQFISKIGTYGVILLFASLCDVAMMIAKAPVAFLLPVITAVLSCTELLSCLENLSECNVSVAGELITIVKNKKNKLKQ
ncbi:MAG: phage holin family protein [Acidaminococcaceae bacterium]|nr:phage holin family protein [Acidaminococcaceae bacterium]